MRAWGCLGKGAPLWPVSLPSAKPSTAAHAAAYTEASDGELDDILASLCRMALGDGGDNALLAAAAATPADAAGGEADVGGSGGGGAMRQRSVRLDPKGSVRYHPSTTTAPPLAVVDSDSGDEQAGGGLGAYDNVGGDDNASGRAAGAAGATGGGDGDPAPLLRRNQGTASAAEVQERLAAYKRKLLSGGLATTEELDGLLKEEKIRIAMEKMALANRQEMAICLTHEDGAVDTLDIDTSMVRRPLWCCRCGVAVGVACPRAAAAVLCAHVREAGAWGAHASRARGQDARTVCHKGVLQHHGSDDPNWTLVEVIPSFHLGCRWLRGRGPCPVR